MKKARSVGWRLRFASLLLALPLLPVSPAQAAAVPGEYGTIQAAINAVAVGELPDGTVIEVAPGTYFESLDVVTTPHSFTVRGVGGAPATVVNAQGTGLPAVRVRFATGAVRFEGLTFTGGTADTAGGFLIHDSAAPVFANCVVTGNQSTVDGGGGLIARSTVTFDGCVIRDNTANRFGGGILVNESSRLTFVNGRIEGNRSGLAAADGAGGGLLVLDSSATIRTSVITRNQSVFAGGGIHVLGQFGPPPSPASLVLEDSEVSSNTTRRFGPSSPPAEGGAVHIEANAQATLTRAVIRGNAADQGGGLNAFQARYDVTGSFIEGNTALDAVSGLGGGISAFGFGAQPTTITLTDTVVRNNQARLGGGVLASGADGCGAPGAGCMALTITASLIDGNTAQTQGGGIYAKLGTLGLAGSQVFRNQATGTSGGQGGGGLILIRATATITDTTIAGNGAAQFGGGIFVHQGTALTVDRSNIYANAAGSGVTNGGGGLFVTRTAPVPTGVVRNSVIADNTNFQIQEEACPPLAATLLEYRNNTIATLGTPLYNSVCFPPGQATTISTFNGIPGGRASGNVGSAPSFVSFAATPDRGPSVLAWSVARASSVSITNAAGPLAIPTASKDVSPAVATTYALTASTPSGTLSGTATVQSCGPTVRITRSASQVRAGQTLVVGLEAQNPAGCAAADLYAGFLAPDGSSVVFFSAPGVVAATAALATPNRFVPMLALAPGASLSEPALFQLTVTPGGVVPGTYQFFGALVRPGVFQDNRIDPGDLLVLDLQPVVISP